MTDSTKNTIAVVAAGVAITVLAAGAAVYMHNKASVSPVGEVDRQTVPTEPQPTFQHVDDPMSEFRNWWQMIPNLAGSNDSYKSWPSGNMTIASMMFSLPMLSDVLKNSIRNGRL